MKIWLLVAGLFTTAGCTQQVYDLELNPRQDQVERQLTVQRTEARLDGERRTVPFPEDELRQIADAYGQELPDVSAEPHTFRGQFQGRLPSDIGGHGTHTYFASPLGSCSAYVERFRGDDDALAQLEQRQAAVDRLTDLLIRWFEAELDADEGWPALRTWLDSELRRDLKNLAIYSWSLGAVSDAFDVKFQELGIRMVQYLVEREYVSPDGLPRLVRAVSDVGQGDERRLLEFIRGWLAARLGHSPESEEDSLAFLRDRETLEQSLRRFLRTTDEHRRRHEQWQREHGGDSDAERPDEMEVVGEWLLEAFLPHAFEFMTSSPLNVRLVLPVEPFSTNGEWDVDQRVVRWTHSLPARDETQRRWPKMAFAIWSEPDIAAQERHFGSVVLDGHRLATYCVWYRGLTSDEARQWDTFLTWLAPRDDLSDHLKQLRLPGEPEDEEAPNPFKAGRELLLEALRADE